MTMSKVIEYVKKMVDFEAISVGQDHAFEIVARRVHTTPYPIEYIYRRKAKRGWADIQEQVYKAYLEHCQKQIRRLQSEISEIPFQGDADDCMANITAEIAALAAEVKKRKEMR